MLKDIVDRSHDLGQLYAERLKSDDGYQVIDHRTVASTFQELLQKAVADPAPIIKEQLALWSDLALLWQRTAARALFNAPVEPVIEPARQDKRFRSELWTENPYFDYAKQSYLLMSRFFQSSVRNVTGRRSANASQGAILHAPVRQFAVAGQFRRDQSGRSRRDAREPGRKSAQRPQESAEGYSSAAADG